MCNAGVQITLVPKCRSQVKQHKQATVLQLQTSRTPAWNPLQIALLQAVRSKRREAVQQVNVLNTTAEKVLPAANADSTHSCCQAFLANHGAATNRRAAEQGH